MPSEACHTTLAITKGAASRIARPNAVETPFTAAVQAVVTESKCPPAPACNCRQARPPAWPTTGSHHQNRRRQGKQPHQHAGLAEFRIRCHDARQPQHEGDDLPGHRQGQHDRSAPTSPGRRRRAVPTPPSSPSARSPGGCTRPDAGQHQHDQRHGQPNPHRRRQLDLAQAGHQHDGGAAAAEHEHEGERPCRQRGQQCRRAERRRSITGRRWRSSGRTAPGCNRSASRA